MANNSIIVKPQGQTHILVGNSANRTPIVVNPSSTGCSGGGGGNINITPYITMDGGSVVFNYFTPKQMAKVYIWLEGGNLWFELTKDEEGQYSLTTKCDIQELDGMFIVGGEEFIVNTIVDSFIVDLKGYKVSEVRIEGIDADLLDVDFTWKLAEIGNKVDGAAKEATSQKILEEVSGIKGDNPDATNSAIYDAINAISPDVVQGKERLATAITSKGVETTSADSLSQMAEKVKCITYNGILKSIHEPNTEVTVLTDADKDWVLRCNAETALFAAYPNLQEVHYGCKKVEFQTASTLFSKNIEYHFDALEEINVGEGLFNGKTFSFIISNSITKDIYFPNLRSITGYSNTFYLINGVDMNTSSSPYSIYAPKLGIINRNMGLFGRYNAAKAGLKKLVLGQMKTDLSLGNATASHRNLELPNLIHLEVGYGSKGNMHFNYYTPTMALRTDISEFDYLDLREDTNLPDNHTQFIVNFRKYFLLRLANLTGESALKITLSNVVYTAITTETRTLAELGVTELTELEIGAGITLDTPYNEWLDTYRAAINWTIAHA